MYLADKTGNDKYLLAAKKLMKWMENVHRPDGSWMNDVHVSDWSGTTVFAAIALYEAVHYHGHLLDDSTRNHWKEQLLEAGEFMMKNPQMYSRRMQGSMKRLNNVNYSASVTYALQALGEMFDRPDFKEEARIVASDLKKFFTANDFFLYGEGPKIWTPTKNGCLPVDLGYNVEESLPNLAYYALMVNDRESNFRKMLTLEQYRDPKLAQLHHDYLAGGPLEYMAAIFRKFADSDEDAMQLALEFYGPMYLLYSVYDGAKEKESVSSLLATHIDHFIAKVESDYRKKE